MVSKRSILVSSLCCWLLSMLSSPFRRSLFVFRVMTLRFLSFFSLMRLCLLKILIAVCTFAGEISSLSAISLRWEGPCSSNWRILRLCFVNIFCISIPVENVHYL